MNSLGNRAERLRCSKLHPQWQVIEGKGEGRPREYIHTHMNVHEDKRGDSRKGEEEMKLPLLIPDLSAVK
jgi:hypothetical protein